MIKKLKHIGRGAVAFLAVILACSAGIAVLLSFYISAGNEPYMQGEVYDLSEGWLYSTKQSEPLPLGTLITGPNLQAGETMTLFRTLDMPMADAAILVRANHQSVNAYIVSEGAEIPLYLDDGYQPGQNPGMALHYILLPDNYLNKTLKLEITSPYELYSGRTYPVYLGTVSSLEAFTLSLSLRPLIFMAVCLALGIAIIAFTFVQALGGLVRKGQLAMGVFAVLWALYYVCTEYIAFLFFTPRQMSALSLGLYFSFQAPLVLFIYFSMRHYKRWLLPSVFLHSGFPAAALFLMAFGVTDLPKLINLNNILLFGLIYTVVFTVLEAIKKNRLMVLTAPFFIIAYTSMLYNFNVFYTRSGVVPYSYRDTFALLILAVLIFSVWQFFRDAHLQQREMELLSLQKRLAQDSYDNIKTHLREAMGLKHEIKSHLAAMRTYLEHGRVDEARSYLDKFAVQAATVTETALSGSDNLLISAVAGSLLQRAAEQGIKVELNLKASPAHIADPDFYSLLTNITENALEACQTMPEGTQRFINLTIGRHGPYLNIRCANSRSGEIISENGRPKTTKAEDGHGYGLWTIGRIVEAYGGMMDIAYDENSFTLTAALKDR